MLRRGRSPGVVVMARMLGRRHALQVLWAIVGLVAITMMHDFVATKSTAKDAFHHDTVLAHVPFRVGIRMVRHTQQDVASRVQASATAPLMVICSGLFRRMAASVRCWMAKEQSPSSLGIETPDGRGLTTAALADPARDFTWQWPVLSAMRTPFDHCQARVVSGEEPTIAPAMPRLGLYRFAATAFAHACHSGGSV